MQVASRIAASSRLQKLLSFSLYLSVLLALAATHEPWRDEVRAWSVIQEAGGLSELFVLMRAEGHPFVWYLFLLCTGAIVQSPVALKVSALLAALGSSIVLLRAREFSITEKFLWLFGVLPLYEYSIQCRNYGIGMFFLFLFCSLYSQRWKQPLLLACTILLLANTSAFGFILASSLFAILLCEIAWHSQKRNMNILALLLVAFGLLITALQMYPRSDSIVTTSYALNLVSLLKGLLYGLTSQSWFAQNALSLRFPLPFPLLLLPLYICIRRQRLVCLFLFLTAGGIASLNELVYPATALRHQGFLILSFLCAIWIYRIREAEDSKSDSHATTGVKVLLALLLLLQIDGSLLRALPDFNNDMTSAQKLATFIKSKPGLQDVILLAEPDYYAESLPYYSTIPIYLVREKRFRSFVSFSTANAKTLRLAELTQTAKRLNKKHEAQVLLLFGHQYSKPGKYQFSYDKTFSFSGKEKQKFKNKFTKLATFSGALTDENYSLYQFVSELPEGKNE